MSKIIMQAQGLDGTMTLLNDRVVIHRPGFLNFIRYGASAKREIPLSAIAEVIFRAPTIFTMGELELVSSGRVVDKRGVSKNNANCMKFARKKVVEFDAMKEKIFVIMDQAGRK